jgi:capsular polysaccharide biosynthesis protein
VSGAQASTRVVIDPDRVEQDLTRLVLTLVEFLRRLMEAQAVRRLEAETITEDEAERLGLTLLRAKEAVAALCERLSVAPDSLNLDLGPLGRLL